MTGLTEGDADRFLWNACKGGTYRGGLKMATEGILSLIYITLLPLRWIVALYSLYLPCYIILAENNIRRWILSNPDDVFQQYFDVIAQGIELWERILSSVSSILQAWNAWWLAARDSFVDLRGWMNKGKFVSASGDHCAGAGIWTREVSVHFSLLSFLQGETFLN